MTADDVRDEVPADWDRLAERSAGTPPGPATIPAPRPEARPLPPPVAPPVLTLVAASWGDGLAVLAVVTAAVAAVHVLGYGFGLAVVWWAGGAALAWWLLAAAALVAIRQGTAGMLMAGVVFAEPVPPRKVLSVLAVAVACALTLGLPGILGPRRHPLAITGGSPLVHVGTIEVDARNVVTRGA